MITPEEARDSRVQRNKEHRERMKFIYSFCQMFKIQIHVDQNVHGIIISSKELYRLCKLIDEVRESK